MAEYGGKRRRGLCSEVIVSRTTIAVKILRVNKTNQWLNVFV